MTIDLILVWGRLETFVLLYARKIIVLWVLLCVRLIRDLCVVGCEED